MATALIQARLSSSRLRGKALRKLAGVPVIERVRGRLLDAQGINRIVVATSAEASDDPIARHCEQEGIECARGPLDDVAARLIGAAEERGLDSFVRVNGDSPLIDPAIVDRGVELFGASDADLVTNVHPRTFPVGQSVEVIRTETARRAHPEMDAEEREHVTPFFYAHPERFEIVNFERTPAATWTWFSVDTAADAGRLEALIEAMQGREREFGLDRLLELEAELGLTPEAAAG